MGGLPPVAAPEGSLVNPRYPASVGGRMATGHYIRSRSHGAYRAPLKGLYMCGSSTHPGGGVTGVPGHNAAREILGDIRAGRV